MRHPFELDITELKNINFELEGLGDEVTEKIVGGNSSYKLQGEIIISSLSNSKIAGDGATTMATQEEGGDKPISMATNEQGGD